MVCQTMWVHVFLSSRHLIIHTNIQVRVRIVRIQFHTTIVETLGQKPKRFALPRIRFKISLPFGRSFKIIRTQFPLRLAYCLTLNKSQSQTFEKAVVDVGHEPFRHGQLYVAMSRVRESQNIMIYCQPNQVIHGSLSGVVITNVVYPTLLLSNDDFIN